MATPSRNVRVADDVWDAAQDVLARRGTTVSAYLRGKLTELVEADRAHQAWAAGLGSDATVPPEKLAAVRREEGDR